MSLAVVLAACGGGGDSSRSPDAALAEAAAHPPGNALRPGALALEPPTLRALAVEWTIEGDDNHNAVATVQYRQSGQTEWKEGLPLFRLHNEQVGPEMGLPPELAGFDYTP